MTYKKAIRRPNREKENHPSLQPEKNRMPVHPHGCSLRRDDDPHRSGDMIGFSGQDGDPDVAVVAPEVEDDFLKASAYPGCAYADRACPFL